LLFGRLYGPRDQRGNMGKRQPPLYLPVYLHCLSDCLYSPPSSLCLILQFFSLASERIYISASLSSDTFALQLVRIGSNQSNAK
jgi:hypothetical protein